MEGEEYTAKDLKKYFEEKSIDTWDYSQGVMYMLMEWTGNVPNSIEEQHEDKKIWGP